MRRFRIFLPVLMMLSLGSLACGFVGGAFGPNPIDTASTATLPPSVGTPEAIGQSATAIPGSAQTPLTNNGSKESIVITLPLPGQGVSGVVHIEGVSDPTFEQAIGILVRDQTGKVIAIDNVRINAAAGQRGKFSDDLTLPSGSMQPGRIVVFSTSARDGGVMHLASIDVELNSSQPSNSTVLSPDRAESILIASPAPNASISKSVTVSGVSDPTLEQSLVVEVRDQNNQSLGRATAHINAEAGQRGSFSIDVPFQVSAAQPGRIIMYSLSARDGLTMHLTSVEVNLQP